MDATEVLRVIGAYKRRLSQRGIASRPHPHDARLVSERAALEHCHHMLDVMRLTLLPEGRMEKAFRWLGFVQGVLWASGVFTIRELKQHNVAGLEDTLAAPER